MRLLRADALRLLVSVPVATLLPPRALAVVFTADDKSFRLALPESWRLDSTAPRAEQPQRIFHLRGESTQGATLEVTVDPSAQKRLSELGSLDSVAARLLASQPQPTSLLKAVTVPRPSLFAMDTYELRFRSGSSERIVKMGLQQYRLYQLAVSLPADPTPEERLEVDALVASFETYPLNLGCLRSSNEGTLLPGVCY